MNPPLPSIYFYYPRYNLFADNMPESVEASWQWMFNEGRPKYNVFDGEYAWVLQTYLHLKQSGFPCQITGTLPEEGIILAHRINLSFELKPGPKQLIVCLQADKAPHPYAQMSVVLNPQGLITKYSFLGDVHAPRSRGMASKPFKNRYYMPHWPLPAIIPRDPARGNQFENVVFFGVGRSLAPELSDPAWRQQLKALGLNWHFRGYRERVDSWIDYSEVDVVLAVRRFDRSDKFAWKPATKLYNAWHAGVPAILGCESAYQAERKCELDYLEITTAADALLALKRLQNDLDFRKAIVENGRLRAQETKPENLVAQWQQFLIETVTPAYERWCSEANWSRQMYLKSCQAAVAKDRVWRYLDFKVEGIQRRLQKVSSQNESIE